MGPCFSAQQMERTALQLWRSDGTSTGTVLVKDIGSGPGGSNPTYLTNVNGTLLFAAHDFPYGAYGDELWRSNGTAPGTLLLRDTNETYSSNPSSLVNLNGTLLFAAQDSPYNRPQLWESNGTSAGTHSVLSVAGFYGPANLTNVNGTLFFSEGYLGALWRSDGTANGTEFLVQTGGDNFAYNLTNVNGTLFFSGTDVADGRELWVSDGTVGGTQLVKDINPGHYRYYYGYGSYPQQLTNVNGELFFTADDGTHGRQVWESNGTAGGTTLVSTNTFSPGNLINISGTLLFSASDTSGYGLWKSDGTVAGTVLVANITTGVGKDAAIADLTNVDGTLFFVANDGTHGNELWMSNGVAAGTCMVKDIDPGPTSSNPSNLTNISGTLFFTADNGQNGVELWRSNGTVIGTVPVVSTNVGTTSRLPAYFTNVNGRLFFAANDGIHGTELWASNGSPAGTVLAMDINGGSAGSYPHQLTNVSGTLFFVADDGIHGNEPWMLGPVPQPANSRSTPAFAISSLAAPAVASTQAVGQNALPRLSPGNMVQSNAPPGKMHSFSTKVLSARRVDDFFVGTMPRPLSVRISARALRKTPSDDDWLANIW